MGTGVDEDRSLGRATTYLAVIPGYPSSHLELNLIESNYSAPNNIVSNDIKSTEVVFVECHILEEIRLCGEAALSRRH